MDWSQLAKIGDMIATSDNFGDVYRVFLEQFGNQPEFMAHGKPLRHPLLEKVIREVGPQLIGEPTLVHNILLIGLPREGFIHGACNYSGRVGSVIFFERTGWGLLAVAPPPGSDEMKIARFQSQPLAPNPGAN